MSTDYTPVLSISQLNHNNLSVSPVLIHILGSSSAVMFALMQRYAMEHNGDWFPKSYKEWAVELGLTVPIVKRCINGHPNAPHKIPLTEFGVDVMRAHYKGAPTNFYRINWKRVENFLGNYKHLIDQSIEDEVRRVWGEKYVEWLKDCSNVE